MLVKDQFKRIDWVDIFEFKLPDITELDIKKSFASTNKIQSMTASGDSTSQQTIGR